jgi:dUTP pyrophosphatase
MVQVNIKLLSNDKLLIPERKNLGDSGFDLKAAHDEIVESKTVKLIKTGICVEIPLGYEGQVRTRSGMALKTNAFVLNSPGTIDSGYRGEVGVILANLSNEKLVIQKYDRVAQLVINQIPEVVLMPVDNLSDTERGAGGFGSTGIK